MGELRSKYEVSHFEIFPARSRNPHALSPAANVETNPAEARKAVYQFLMDQGANKSTAALCRDAGALVYRALAAKFPNTLRDAVEADNIGSAVNVLRAAVPGDATRDRATLKAWAETILGVRKVERAEKTILERLQAMIAKDDGFTSSEAAAISKYLAMRLDETSIPDVSAALVNREAALSAETLQAEADELARERGNKALADFQADTLLTLKVA
jgi:uncharacterized protein YfkK (UPF0435 family)